jgi:hypothetical protein
MDTCASILGCQSIDYHLRTQQCYLGKRQAEPTNSAPGWASAHSTGCSGACEVSSCNNKNTENQQIPDNQQGQTSGGSTTPSPPPPPATLEVDCTTHNNQDVEVDGQKWRTLSGKQYGAGFYSNAPASSMTECLKRCNDDKKCKSVDMWDPNGVKGCYLFERTTEPSGMNTMCCAAIQV